MFAPRSLSCLRVALALIALSAVSSSALAQERIELFTYVSGQYRVVEVDASVSGFGTVRHVTPIPASLAPVWLPLDPTAPLPVFAVAGGQYLVWNNSGLIAFDRQTRTAFRVAQLGDFIFTPQMTFLAADSHRPRLFVNEQRFGSQVLWSVDLTGGPPVRLNTVAGFFTTAAYAPTPDLLIYRLVTLEAGALQWLVAVNASTGEEVKRWSVSPFHRVLDTTPDGGVVWTWGNGLTAYDALTGAILAYNPAFDDRRAFYDADRRLLFARQGDFLAVLDPLSLAEIGRTRVANNLSSDVIVRTDATLPGRWMTGAYTVRTETGVTLLRAGRVFREDIVEKTCHAILVDAIAPDGTRRASADVLTSLGLGGSQVGERGSLPNCSAMGVVVRSPFAPTDLSAEVSGTTVTLYWADPGDALGFELEYGVVPGQRAGSLRLSDGTTQVAIPNVPPGVYYVRVKAFNAVGTGPASNEVRVVVP